MSRSARRALLDPFPPGPGNTVEERAAMEETRNGGSASGQPQNQTAASTSADNQYVNKNTRRTVPPELKRDSSQESDPLGASSEERRDVLANLSSASGRSESLKDLRTVEEPVKDAQDKNEVRFHGNTAISFHGDNVNIHESKSEPPPMVAMGTSKDADSELDVSVTAEKPASLTEGDVKFFITKDERSDSEASSQVGHSRQGSHASDTTETSCYGNRDGTLTRDHPLHSAMSHVSAPELGNLLEPGTEKAQAILGHEAGRQTPDRKDLIGRETPGRSGNANGHTSDSSSKAASEGGSNTLTTKSRSADGKKKKGYWYNVLSPTYKSRSEEFKKIFKDIPNEERLIVDYSCALQKDILVHGRLYITQNWICFYANIFRWETILTIRCKDIVTMTKEKTARVIPNAIQICNRDEKYFFTSFGARDKTYLMMFRVWQNALTEQYMTPQELWQWVHYSYGEELALTSDDEDYVAPSHEDETNFQSRLTSDDKQGTGPPEAISEGKELPEDGDSLMNGNLTGQPSAPSPDSISIATASTEDSYVLPPGERKTTLSPPRSLQVPTLGVSNGDIPTDLSDNTDDDDSSGEVICEGHDHYHLDVINEIVDISVDKCFELIFTESKVYRAFTVARKTYDLQLTPWPEEPDSDGNKTRTITYTLSLNYSIGPKSSPSEEKQTIYSTSRPGQEYYIESECVNRGIPYGENFYVVNRYCINKVSSNRCRIRVTSQVKYRKSVWGLVKNFIEKNATGGIMESFGALAVCLREEVARITALSAEQKGVTRKKVLRRKRTTSERATTAKQPNMAAPTHKRKAPSAGLPSQGLKATEEWHVKLTSDSLVKIVCVVLLVLLLLNSMLFYKLWNLESRAFSHQNKGRDLLHNIQGEPKSNGEWVKLLEQQQSLHEEEIGRWKDILSASVQLMDNMKRTLVDLQESIEHRQRFTVPPPPPSGNA